MNFRKVTAIIHTEKLDKVEKVLRVAGVPGMSITHVTGVGEYKNLYSKDYLSPHARVEVFIEAKRAEEIAMAIMDAAHTGVEGDGIVAVLPVESIYHICTRKKCTDHAC